MNLTSDSKSSIIVNVSKQHETQQRKMLAERGFAMKLILPNNEVVFLDDNFAELQKKIEVDKILSTWGDYFSKTWKLPKTKICLDILSTYLNKEPKKQKDDDEDGEKE